jgi:hypothetical protein
MNNDAQMTSVAIHENTMRFASGLTAVRPLFAAPGNESSDPPTA